FFCRFLEDVAAPLYRVQVLRGSSPRRAGLSIGRISFVNGFQHSLTHIVNDARLVVVPRTSGAVCRVPRCLLPRINDRHKMMLRVWDTRYAIFSLERILNILTVEDRAAP